MPKEKLTLGIGLLFAGATLAHGNYTIRKGDTLVGIAHKLHVSGPALRIANGLGKKNTLRVGMRLTVPGSKNAGAKVAKATKRHPAVAKMAGDTYTVKPGDNDWTIASHVGLKLKQLHKLNPGVAWTKIRPGTKIHLPSGMAAAALPRLRSRYAVVVKPAVVRRAWSKGAPRVALLPPHTHAVVLAREGSWYKVKSTGGSLGWVRGDLLRATSAPLVVAHRAPAVVHHATVTYVAAMRRRPSRAQRIAHWQNHVANVRAKYVRIWNRQQRRYVVAPLANGGDLVARAESFKGVRYSWGHASRSATDCSGFTTQVFNGEGVRLPRTSRQQATVGNKVDRNHLDKGDLVFFATGRGHRITHVGMYLGNGKFIHASSGGGHVQESKLSDHYYANRFVTARRIPKKGAKAKPVETPKPAEAPPTVAEETTGQ